MATGPGRLRLILRLRLGRSIEQGIRSRLAAGAWILGFRLILAREARWA
jgi:hypothetical protein